METVGGGLQGSLYSSLVAQTLAERHEVRFEVRGNSMLPFLRPGDTVHARPAAQVGLKPGDVVVLRLGDGNGLIVHRLVAQRGDDVWVRGDNRRCDDGRFGSRRVIGVVTRVERDGRSVWFGSGCLKGAIAFAVRAGLMWRLNRLAARARRRVAQCLKFLQRHTRLRQHKGDDRNE
jgi:hypothetical protein